MDLIRLTTVEDIIGHGVDPRQDVLAPVRKAVDDVQTWTETIYRFAAWQDYLDLPAELRYRTLPPVPSTDARHAARASIAHDVAAIRPRLDAGLCQESFARYQWVVAAIQRLTIQLLDDPPKCPQGRRLGSGVFPHEEALLAVILPIIRRLREPMREPTRENVARYLLSASILETDNLDSAVKTLQRSYRRYGYVWQ